MHNQQCWVLVLAKYLVSPVGLKFARYSMPDVQLRRRIFRRLRWYGVERWALCPIPCTQLVRHRCSLAFRPSQSNDMFQSVHMCAAGAIDVTVISWGVAYLTPNEHK